MIKAFHIWIYGWLMSMQFVMKLLKYWFLTLHVTITLLLSLSLSCSRCKVSSISNNCKCNHLWNRQVKSKITIIPFDDATIDHSMTKRMDATDVVEFPFPELKIISPNSPFVSALYYSFGILWHCFGENVLHRAPNEHVVTISRE